MTTIDALRGLTHALYEAALDPQRLPVFLRELTDIVGADAGVLAAGGWETPDASSSLSHGFAEAPAVDAFLGPAGPTGTAAWQKAADDPAITDSITLTVAPDAGEGGFLALLRREGRFPGPLHDDLEVLRPHLPHALRLLRIVDRARRETEVTRSLADSVGHAVAVIDAEATLIVANRAFRRLAARQAAMTLTGDRLSLAAGDAQARLSALLSDGAQRWASGRRFAGGALNMPRPAPARPLGLILAPVPDGPRPLFRLHVSALEAVPVPPTEILRGLFDLTPAEARLLRALMQDQRIEDVAASRGVSVTTVRTQLAHLFRKTGTNRQPELVRLAGVAAGCLDYAAEDPA